MNLFDDWYLSNEKRAAGIEYGYGKIVDVFMFCGKDNHWTMDAIQLDP